MCRCGHIAVAGPGGHGGDAEGAVPAPVVPAAEQYGVPAGGEPRRHAGHRGGVPAVFAAGAGTASGRFLCADGGDAGTDGGGKSGGTAGLCLRRGEGAGAAAAGSAGCRRGAVRAGYFRGAPTGAAHGTADENSEYRAAGGAGRRHRGDGGGCELDGRHPHERRGADHPRCISGRGRLHAACGGRRPRDGAGADPDPGGRGDEPQGDGLHGRGGRRGVYGTGGQPVRDVPHQRRRDGADHRHPL